MAHGKDKREHEKLNREIAELDQVTIEKWTRDPRVILTRLEQHLKGFEDMFHVKRTRNRLEIRTRKISDDTRR